jgi:DHA3 family macrolide efflux protein-like MFS transporter
MGMVCVMQLPQGARAPALAAAAAVSGIGGPLKDIPFATMRQMLIPLPDIAAAMRAYLIMSYSGVLAAMLIAPAACALLGPAPVILVCGVVYFLVAAIGVLRT